MRKIKKQFRCSICPAVSDPAMRNNPDDPVSKDFHPDPKNKHQFICDDCNEAILDLNAEYFVRDGDGKFNYEF